MPADPKKFVTNRLPEFLLLALEPYKVLDSAVGLLDAVVVCYDAQNFYKNYETLAGDSTRQVVWDEFASYCESKIQRHFAAAADADYQCCMTVSDLIRMASWARLYDRVGPGLMKFLLFDCLLFVPVAGNAYYCVRTPSQLAGRYEILRSFWAAGCRRKPVATTVRKNERNSNKTAPPSRFNVAGLLTCVKPICRADVDDMLQSILKTGHLDETADSACFGRLKRKLRVMVGKDSLSKYKAVYKEVVGDATPVADVPLGRIKKFATAVVRKTVPRELFGVNRNRDQYCENLCKVLNGGKFQDYSPQHIVHKIKMGKLKWLDCVTDDGRRTEIMTATLVWLTNSFVFDRIAHFFRIVTTNTPNNGIAYFAKAVWDAACQEKISPLVNSGQFFKEVLSPSESSSYRDWKVCPCAKPNGVRLIYKLRRRESEAEKLLTDECLTFLRCLSRTYPVEFRSVSKQQFFDGWRTLQESRDSLLPVYYVRTDFRDAFTSIKQEKLLAVVRDRIKLSFGKQSQTVNMHTMDAVTIGSGGSVYSKKLKYVGELPPPDLLQGSLVFYRETAVVPLTRICNEVKKCVKRNTIERGGRRWTVTRGIVQGDRLSVILCDLLLADLQATHLKDLTDVNGGCLYRFVDDYVFISSDQTAACQFLTTMSAGFNEYGLQLNQSKTETNLQVGAGNGTFKFLGFQLNVNTGEVTKDVGAYRNRRPLHYFDYGLGRGNPGRGLYAKMTAIRQHAVPATLVNKSFNSAKTATQNLASTVAYRAFAVMTAIKQYFLHLNTVFVIKTVHAIARLIYSKMYGLKGCAAITPMQSKWVTYEVYARMFRSHFFDKDPRILWILDRICDLQSAAGQKCNTTSLKVALRRYNFTNMFG